MSSIKNLVKEFDRYFTSTNGVDVPARVSVPRDEWRTLRQAIAGAEQTPRQPEQKQETPYEIGQRIAKTGGGMANLWSAVPHDSELAEAERGFKEAIAEAEQVQPVAIVHRQGCDALGGVWSRGWSVLMRRN